MSCKIKDIDLKCVVNGEDWGKTSLMIVDYRDGTWALKFGPYNCQTTVNFNDESMDKLINTLIAMMDDNYMATIGGDFEKEAQEEMDW